jgi:hypothetical protein
MHAFSSQLISANRKLTPYLRFGVFAARNCPTRCEGVN